MSDAGRPGRVERERLDWGDAAATSDSESAGDTEPPDDLDATEGATDSADEGDLCVIEDPTCEACQ